MHFKRKELEKFRCFKGPLIDVRSPSEYYKGHKPNSINIPLFDDDERSIIGTIYKKEGRKKAVIEGLKFFEKKIELLLDNLFKSIESHKTIPYKNNELHTPTPDSFLNGITRQAVIELAKSKNIKVHERKISPDELGNFDGCFLTGTAAEITPVASIADHKYKICDVILGLSKSFDQLVRQKKAA